VTLPEGFGEAEGFGRRFNLPLTRIGGVAVGAGVRVLRDGRPMQPGRGFSHF
jgi:hypothetical protein